MFLTDFIYFYFFGGEKVTIFCYMFAILKTVRKTFFGIWLVWKIAKYSLYFHIILRVTRKRDDEKELREEEIERIKGFR